MRERWFNDNETEAILALTQELKKAGFELDSSRAMVYFGAV